MTSPSACWSRSTRSPGFEDVAGLVRSYAAAAKNESETIKSDPAIFSVWPEFVVSGDQLAAFRVPVAASPQARAQLEQGAALVREGKRLIEWIAFARVPMPKTTENFFGRCDGFSSRRRR